MARRVELKSFCIKEMLSFCVAECSGMFSVGECWKKPRKIIKMPNKERQKPGNRLREKLSIASVVKLYQTEVSVAFGFNVTNELEF